mgnify:FL=1
MRHRNFIKVFACMLLVTGTLTGCRLKSQKKEISKNDPDYVINANRTTEGYNYDWIDFMNISVYGSDGVAYIEVTPKTVSANDFQSDEDYIKMKKVLDTLNLSYKAGANNSNTKMVVNPDSNLKTGDVVTFSLTTTVDASLKMNTQEYEFRIPTLNDSSTIDLFSEDDVIFFGLQDTNELYFKFTGNTSFSDELQKYIIYTIKPDSALKEDATVLTITAELSNDFMKSNSYPSFAMYLSKYGYEAESFSTQKVLHNMATPIDFGTVRTDKVVSALYDKVSTIEINSKGESQVNQIASVHKLNRDTDPYTLYVVYQDMDSEGNVKYLRRQFRAAILGDEIVILSMNNEENTSEQYTTQAYEGGELEFTTFVAENSEENTENADNTETAE